MGDGGAYLALAVSASYVDNLDRDRGIRMVVRYTTRGTEVTDYAVVLVVQREDQAETVRVYDSAHGHNEMHRYSTATGKQSGIAFHSGTLGEGMRMAIAEIKSRHAKMIDGWEEG